MCKHQHHLHQIGSSWVKHNRIVLQALFYGSTSIKPSGGLQQQQITSIKLVYFPQIDLFSNADISVFCIEED